MLRLLASFFVDFYSTAYNLQWKIANTAKTVIVIFVVFELYRHADGGHSGAAALRSAHGWVRDAGGRARRFGWTAASGAGRKDPELTIHRFQAFFRTMDSWMLILMALII